MKTTRKTKMKTMMIRLLPMGKIGRLAVIWLAAALAALVLGGCAPRMVWVNPAKEQQEAELDLAECRALALTQVPASGEWTWADQLNAISQAQKGDYSGHAAARAAAEARERQVAIFSVCMRRKGYILQEVAKPGEEEQSEGE